MVDESAEKSPWICHVCDRRETNGEGQACALCYKITCPQHLQTQPIFNPQSGLYELQPVCICCSTPGLH